VELIDTIFYHNVLQNSLTFFIV